MVVFHHSSIKKLVDLIDVAFGTGDGPILFLWLRSVDISVGRVFLSLNERKECLNLASLGKVLTIVSLILLLVKLT